MKIILTIIAGLILVQYSSLFARNYNLRGETRHGTFYLYSQSLHDSLDFIKLYDSKDNEVNAKIDKSTTHFSPQGQPELKLIQLDYTFNIPLDFDLTEDSLFHLGFRTRQQHNITYDYPFYILSNKPVSDLKLISPDIQEQDVNIKPLFKWTEESHPAIRTYRFQLSTNSTFTDLILDTLLYTTKLQINTELETMMDYYWRVKSEFEENEIGYMKSSFSTGSKTVWSPISIDKYHYAQDIQHLDNNRLILVDHQIGFQISDDNGVTWSASKTPNMVTINVSEVINGVVYASVYDLTDNRYKILKSTNNGNNWDTDFLMPEGDGFQSDKKMRFHNNAKGEFTIAYINRILKFDNISTKNLIFDANPDTSIITGFVELENSDIITVTEYRYVQNDTDKGEICIISNKGKDSRKVFSDYNGEKVDFCSINLLENGYIVASGIISSNKSSIFLLSEDNGETWKISSIIENSKLRSTISTFDGFLISNFYDNPKLITLSKDYGKTWIDITGNLPAKFTAYDIKIIEDSLLYYLSNSNTFYKTNIRTDIDMSVYPVKKVESDSEILDFKWKKNRRAEKYNIQISLNEDFEKVGSIKEEGFFIDEETSNNKYQFTEFDLNTVYYWRVRPFYDGKWMNWYKSENFEVSNTSDVAEFETENKFTIFPNPSNDFIIISLSINGLKPDVATDKVQIFDVLGIEIISESIHPMTSSHRMNVENLPAGVYFIMIGNHVEKFVKL